MSARTERRLEKDVACTFETQILLSTNSSRKLLPLCLAIAVATTATAQTDASTKSTNGIGLKELNAQELVARLGNAPRLPWHFAADSDLDKFLELLKKAPRILDTEPGYRWFFDHNTAPHYDALLCELVRRRVPDTEQALKKKLHQDAENLPQALKEFEEALKGVDDDALRHQFARVERLRGNQLEMLTALRRIQRRPDPLQVIVTMPHSFKAEMHSLPRLGVALKNQDPEKEPVWIMEGGDYRGGRLSRWRVHVWDGDGKQLPIHPTKDGMRGGICTRGQLEFGEEWKTQLQISNYVDFRLPGEYRVQVLYHNALNIADITDDEEFDNLVVFTSEPFVLHVE